MHSHSWSKMLHQLGHSWSLTTGLVWPGPGGMRPGLKPCPGCLHEGTWVWYKVFPELFVTILFTNCFSWKTCHLIHLLVLYWQKVRRTGSIKWMHTGTVHDADQESMSLAASVEALSVLNACVEMRKKQVWKWPPHSLQMLWNTITTTKTCGNMHQHPSCSHNPNHTWKTVANQSSSTQHPPWRKPTTDSRISPLWFPVEQPKLLETWGQRKCCTISSLCCPNSGTNL